MPEKPTPEAAPATAAPPLAVARVRPPSSRPGVLRRSATGARRWVRETFSREQIVAGLKQLAWVAPLTLLIWVYAERAQQDRGTVTFDVVARSGNQDLHVTVVEPENGIVQAVLEGARSRIEHVESRVGAQNPVVIEVPIDAKPGVTTITVAEILDRDPRFSGLTWQESPSSSPARVEVLVDPIEEMTLPVQVRPQDQDRLEAGGAVFTPARVKVRMPSRVAQIARAASQDGQLVVYADLSALRDTANGGKQALPDVRVFVDGAEREEVRIEPANVSATLTLRDADKSLVIEQLPVVAQASTSFHDEYVVTFDPATLFDVEVIGPPRAIETLRIEGDAAVSAFVPVFKEDAGEARQKKVNFILPPGVRLDPKNADRSVRVTVTPRTSPAQ